MIIKFELYNESLRDKMKGKSKEEIAEVYRTMEPNRKFKRAYFKGIDWLLINAIKSGANVHFQDDAALKNYVQKGNLKMVKLLIEYGADVNVHNGYPLITSIGYRHSDIAKLLIENGADVNLNNPLVTAVKWNSKDIVKLLLDNGALINNYHKIINDGYMNQQPLDEEMKKILSDYYYKKVNESLKDKLKGKSNDEIDKALYGLSGYNLLLKSVKHNYLKGVKLALDKNKEGIFPRINNSNVLQLTTSKNYRDKIGNNDKFKALQLATLKNYTEISKLLIKNTKISEDNKDIFLRLSALNGNEELVKIYVDLGGDIQSVMDDFNNNRLDNDDDDDNVFNVKSEEQQQINRAIKLLKKYL